MHVYKCMRQNRRCTKIYSVQKLGNTRVRNFYAYENFCDYSISFMMINEVTAHSAFSYYTTDWVASICVTVSFMDWKSNRQTPDTDRFSKCAFGGTFAKLICVWRLDFQSMKLTETQIKATLLCSTTLYRFVHWVSELRTVIRIIKKILEFFAFSYKNGERLS